MTKMTAELLERVEDFAHMGEMFHHGYATLSGRSIHVSDLRALVSLSRRVIEPGEEEIERCARALCAANGFDPEYLEPGDDPYGDNNSVIDGSNSKDEPCHFFWRHYDRQARAVLAAIATGPE